MASTDFAVSKLKSALVSGGARPSLFDFQITGLPSTSITGLTNIKYFCQTFTCYQLYPTQLCCS